MIYTDPITLLKKLIALTYNIEVTLKNGYIEDPE
jgi:hypothetical protein